MEEFLTPQEDPNYVRTFLKKVKKNIDENLLKDDDTYFWVNNTMYGLMDLLTAREIGDLLNTLIKRFAITNKDTLNYVPNFYIVSVFQYIKERNIDIDSDIKTTAYTSLKDEEWFESLSEKELQDMTNGATK